MDFIHRIYKSLHHDTGLRRVRIVGTNDRRSWWAEISDTDPDGPSEQSRMFSDRRDALHAARQYVAQYMSE